jgi:hypothetical protein
MADDDYLALFAPIRAFGWNPKKRESILRGALCWIISTRRASRAERRKYYHRLPRLTEPGQN